FEKSYYSTIARYSRMGLISSVQVLAKARAFASTLELTNIPDLVGGDRLDLRYVVKSVVSLGRAGLYECALDSGSIVFILRHPCAVVASQLRGMRLGKLRRTTASQAVSNSSIGQKYGLSAAFLRALTVEEQLAWQWLVMNEQALEGL